jgi:ABC-type multidrug transport system ATPase subunit
MLIDWGDDDSPPKLERWPLRRVIGSEQLIQGAAHELFMNRTSLVIAHRLSTVLAADQIVVMNHGRTVERGTHRALVEQGGFCAALYERQLRAPADADDPSAIGAEPTP